MISLTPEEFTKRARDASCAKKTQVKVSRRGFFKNSVSAAETNRDLQAERLFFLLPLVRPALQAVSYLES